MKKKDEEIMKFSIGEFSRITALSIKSLRLYHEKGLLVPAEVDTSSGYRFYDEKNYEVAKSIKILKEYEFSLAEIKEILAECDDEADILAHLQKKLQTIRNEISRYKEISCSIELTIQAERESAMKTDVKFEIEEKELDIMLIAGYRMQGKYDEAGEGFKLLGKKFGRFINGKPLTLYFDGEYKEEDADFETCFPVRKGKKIDGISVRELKGGKAVTLIHQGPYENLSDSYKKLFSYIHEKGYKTILPTREVYLKGPGMIFKGNANNYLTEIQIFLSA